MCIKLMHYMTSYMDTAVSSQFTSSFPPRAMLGSSDLVRVGMMVRATHQFVQNIVRQCGAHRIETIGRTVTTRYE